VSRKSQIIQVLYEEHGKNILTDAAPHTAKTCPILYWYAKWAAHESGEMNDLDYAEAMLQFFKNKHEAKEPDNCKCVKRLKALGITDWE